MVYMTHVRGRLWECSATLKIFSPHLLMFSRSCWGGQNVSVWAHETPDIKRVSALFFHQSASLTFDSSSSWSVLTPKRFPAPPEMLEVWLSFLTPLICVIIPPCCCCCCCCCCWPCLLFLSLDFGTGHGSSNSFCLSGGNRIKDKKIQKMIFFLKKSAFQISSVARDSWLEPPNPTAWGDSWPLTPMWQQQTEPQCLSSAIKMH